MAIVGLSRRPSRGGGLLLQGFGLLFAAIALAFFVIFVTDASAKCLSLHRSPEGLVCGTYEETRPWGTSVRELPPGSVLRVKSAMEDRREKVPGKVRGRRTYTVQVEVLVVTTTGEDIRFDNPGASVYAKAVLESPPGGPLRTVEAPYPGKMLAVTLLCMAIGALFFFLGLREVRRSEVPPPA